MNDRDSELIRTWLIFVTVALQISPRIFRGIKNYTRFFHRLWQIIAQGVNVLTFVRCIRGLYCIYRHADLNVYEHDLKTVIVRHCLNINLTSNVCVHRAEENSTYSLDPDRMCKRYCSYMITNEVIFGSFLRYDLTIVLVNKNVKYVIN